MLLAISLFDFSSQVNAAIVSGIITIIALLLQGIWLNSRAQNKKAVDDKALQDARDAFARTLQAESQAFEQKIQDLQHEFEEKRDQKQHEYDLSIEAARQWHAEFKSAVDVLLDRAKSAKSAAEEIVRNAAHNDRRGSLQQTTKAFREISSFFDPIPKEHTLTKEIREGVTKLQEDFVELFVAMDFSKGGAPEYVQKLRQRQTKLCETYTWLEGTCMKFHREPELARCAALGKS